MQPKFELIVLFVFIHSDNNIYANTETPFNVITT